MISLSHWASRAARALFIDRTAFRYELPSEQTDPDGEVQ